jgi:hypothetical protein
MQKIISIVTNREKYFQQYITLLHPMHNMRHKEIQVLAQLMYYYDKYRHFDEDMRIRIVFDVDTKMRIRQKLKMSESSFNNNMSELRKKKAIVDNTLAPAWRISTGDNVQELIFKFILKDEPDTNST